MERFNIIFKKHNGIAIPNTYIHCFINPLNIDKINEDGYTYNRCIKDKDSLIYVTKTIYGFNKKETFDKLYNIIEKKYFDKLKETCIKYYSSHNIVNNNNINKLNESENIFDVSNINLPGNYYHFIAKDMLAFFIKNDKNGLYSLPCSTRKMLYNILKYLKHYISSSNTKLSEEETKIYRDLIEQGDIILNERIELKCYKI